MRFRTGAIRNPEAYLYTVASNLAKEHARHEHTDGGVLDVDDPHACRASRRRPRTGCHWDL
jgi:DNA-directed RNA polymerase specialized sigma24 family protein